jgi:hypothetical protein
MLLVPYQTIPMLLLTHSSPRSPVTVTDGMWSRLIISIT